MHNAISTQLVDAPTRSLGFAHSRACALLSQAGISPDGIVFNRMPTRSPDSYYYSDYAAAYANGRGTKPRLKAKLSEARR
jgi:hypothetical protein